MVSDKEFFILRYSLVQEAQTGIEVLDLPSPKGLAVIAAIQQDREFSLNGVTYGLVGFSEVQIDQQANRYYIGKLAKHRQAHIGRKIPRNIIDTVEDDWIPVLIIIDTYSQHILVQKDWKFGTPEQTVRSVQQALREPISSLFGYRVFVEGKTRKEAFWRIVETHKKIYKLDLKLISPNILETNRAARDALEALQKLFMQDEAQVVLTNEDGSLKVPKVPIAGYLEYIQQGEGSWALTTEGARGLKKRHSSSENIDIVTIDIRNEQLDEADFTQLPLEPGLDRRNSMADVGRHIVEQVAEALANENSN